MNPTPFEIAGPKLDLSENYDDLAHEMAVRAVEHYRSGHWAEARTAALISEAFSSLEANLL